MNVQSFSKNKQAEKVHLSSIMKVLLTFVASISSCECSSLQPLKFVFMKNETKKLLQSTEVDYSRFQFPFTGKLQCSRSKSHWKKQSKLRCSSTCIDCYFISIKLAQRIESAWDIEEGKRIYSFPYTCSTLYSLHVCGFVKTGSTLIRIKLSYVINTIYISIGLDNQS